ncbi:MAG: glycosyltransferase family 2 protein [Patescibacteria group bacterium]|nr:glycosyltransferase family 2 protein [Patescibacteria group bacterium]
MQLSVIVPVYNEQATVRQLLTRLVKVPQVKQVVVVDDGSTDKTVREINQVKSSKIELFKKPNGGKGSAVRLGLTKVTGDYVLIQDADLEYDPTDIPAMIEPVLNGKAKIVFGSRFLGPHLNLLFWHRVGNSLLNFLVNILFNTTLSDMETCYKLVPTQVLRDLNLTSHGFDLEPEITCKLLRHGYKIYEVPISYMGRDFLEGKKITWQDGIVAVGVILKLAVNR